jgi:hypothetical protein
MKPLTKAAVWIAAIAALLGLYFASNIYGYYRFKSICAKEAGLKVYQPLERGVGWLQVGGGGGAALTMYGASFTRFKKNEKFYDTVLNTPLKQVYFEKDFQSTPADMSKDVTYELRNTSSSVPDEVRLTKFSTQVIDIKTDKVLVAYSYFQYETFVRANTLLDAPSASSCPEYAIFGPNDSNQQTTPGELYLGIQSAVK